MSKDRERWYSITPGLFLNIMIEVVMLAGFMACLSYSRRMALLFFSAKVLIYHFSARWLIMRLHQRRESHEVMMEQVEPMKVKCFERMDQKYGYQLWRHDYGDFSMFEIVCTKCRGQYAYGGKEFVIDKWSRIEGACRG